MITIKITDNLCGNYEPEINMSGQVSLNDINRVIERLEYARNTMEAFYGAMDDEEY